MPEAGQIQVRLVTPDRTLADQSAAAVELPTVSGYIEVLPGHAPLLSELGSGEVRLHGGDAGDQKYHVSWGFVEVLPERVTILANQAQKPEEIDAAAARQQLDEGNKRWSEAGDSEDKYTEANELIADAESKLASAGK